MTTQCPSWNVRLSAASSNRVSSSYLGLHELLDAEAGLVREHEVDGAGDLGRDDGIGRVLALFCLEAQVVGVELGVGPLAEDGRLHEGPLEVGVAHLAALAAVVLAAALVGARGQAAVADEVLDGGEAGNVDGFVQDRQGQYPADARGGAQKAVILLLVVAGVLLDALLHVHDDAIVAGDDCQLGLGGEGVDRMLEARADTLRQRALELALVASGS